MCKTAKIGTMMRLPGRSAQAAIASTVFSAGFWRSWMALCFLPLFGMPAAAQTIWTVSLLTDTNPTENINGGVYSIYSSDIPNTPGMGAGYIDPATGAYDLRYALQQAIAAGGVQTIEFSSNCTVSSPCTFTLSAPLPPIESGADVVTETVENGWLVAGQLISTAPPALTLTIDGGKFGAVTIDGAGANRVFFVDSGTVTLANLEVQNALAKGGDGAGGVNNPHGFGGGGGGLGAGAGLFVNHSGAVVNVLNTYFSNNQAVGGAGGGSNPIGSGYGAGGGGSLFNGIGCNSWDNDYSQGPLGGGACGGFPWGGVFAGGSGGPWQPGPGYGSNSWGEQGEAYLTGGGTYINGDFGGMGGFGGGGAGGGDGADGGPGGPGGFGGGGGAGGASDLGQALGQGGNGGFGGGGGGSGICLSSNFSTHGICLHNYRSNSKNTGGFGGGNGTMGFVGADLPVDGKEYGGGGAAFGPAIFVLSGVLTTFNSGADSNTSATAGNPGGTDSLGRTPVATAGTAVQTPVYNAYGTVNGVTSPHAYQDYVNTYPDYATCEWFLHSNCSFTATPVGGVASALPLEKPATHYGVLVSPTTFIGGSAATITVTALDPDGNTAASYNGTATLTATDGDNNPIAVLPASLTFSNGLAASSLVLTTVDTDVTVTATDSNTLSSYINGTSGDLTVVGPAIQTITFPAITATEVAATTLALSATASSGLTVSFVSITPTVCTVSGATASLLAEGTCVLQATQPGNSNYAAAPMVQQRFTVRLAAQTISFAPIASQIVGASVPLSATASSGLAVSFVSLTTPVCTVAGSTASMLSKGTCVIHALQGGNNVYSVAPQVSQDNPVQMVSQAITFPAITGAQVATTTLGLPATASSGLTVSFASITPAICTVSGSTASLLMQGTCVIQATQAGNIIYAPATMVQQNFTVQLAPQTITFPTIASQVVGASLPLSATATSGLTVSFTSLTTSVCTVSGITASMLTTGTCVIHASVGGNNVYSVAPQASQNISVQLAPQAITFPAITGTQYAASTLPLSATTSSGLTVSLASITPTICTVTSTTASLLMQGTCAVQATQTGNSTYAAATRVQQKFAVHLAPQTIAFAPVASQIVGANMPLSATATSGLAVSFVSLTAPVCTVAGDTVSGFTASMLAKGTCVIHTLQTGNNVYAAAPQVSQDITVKAN